MELPAASITSISIHAPREGGDASGQTLQGRDRQFQSTPPARGATAALRGWHDAACISIHAPREGGDLPWHTALPLICYFNPRPREGGDRLLGHRCRQSHISIHAPARGATPTSPPSAMTTTYFNPRPPRGGRLLFTAPATPLMEFQSTPPREGGDNGDLHITISGVISIHAPREGGDDDGSPAWQAFFQFQSTPPARGAT